MLMSFDVNMGFLSVETYSKTPKTRTEFSGNQSGASS